MYLPGSMGLFAKKNGSSKQMFDSHFVFFLFIFRETVHLSYMPDWVEVIHDGQQLRYRGSGSGGGTSIKDCTCVCEYKSEYVSVCLPIQSHLRFLGMV